MNASVAKSRLVVPRLLSRAAQVCALALFVGWLALVVGELINSHFQWPSPHAFYQAAALALVFGGYMLSYRHALAGSLAAIVGTVAFFVISFATSGVMPSVHALWFAIPAVLTLAAWAYIRRYPRLGATA